jgi:hypothetical protein
MQHLLLLPPSPAVGADVVEPWVRMLQCHLYPTIRPYTRYYYTLLYGYHTPMSAVVAENIFYTENTFYREHML